MKEHDSDGVVLEPETSGGIVAVQAIPKAIAAALVQAQVACATAGRDATNPNQNYSYTSAEQRIELGKGALNGAGLALMAASWCRVPGGAHDVLVIRWLLVHESGPSLELQTQTACIPQNGRPMDKAEATAMTYATGYLYRLVCAIPSSAKEEDVDQRDDRSHEPPARPRAAPKPAKSTGPSPKRLVDDLRRELGWEGTAAIEVATSLGYPTPASWTAAQAAKIVKAMKIRAPLYARVAELEITSAELEGIAAQVDVPYEKLANPSAAVVGKLIDAMAGMAAPSEEVS